MSGGSGDKIRGLPNGLKTRDELKAQMQKHGSLAESEVLAHINRTAKPAWTHNDFVNFFQKSGQMVFQVKDNHRVCLAPSGDDSSEEETCDIPSTVSVRSRTQNSHAVGARTLTENLSRMTGLGSNSASNPASGSSERRKEPRSAARKVPSSSSSDEDNTRNGGYRKPGSSGASKTQPSTSTRPPPGFESRPEHSAIPYGSDEEEGETLLQKPQASLQGGSAKHNNENGHSSAAEASGIQRDLQELNNLKPNFMLEYCTVKEDREFRESLERNPEKILQDVMEMGRVSREDAELLLEYFVLLQSYDIEYLSNGQLVAGILSLIEADPEGEMRRQIRRSNEQRREGTLP